MAELELPITGHLEELRGRLLRAILAILAAFAVCYPFSQAIFEWLLAPLVTAADSSPAELQIIGTGVAEAFFTRLKVSFIAALFLSLPVILYQIWRFVLPGLKPNEASYGRGFVLVGTGFFLTGALFCHATVFSFAFPFFLAEYERIGVAPAIRLSEYLSFASRLLLAFGLTFELPVATFFLTRVGLVTHEMMIAQARYAVLVVFVLAAILTPPDVVSQVLMAGPLLLLYAGSIGVAYVFRPTPDGALEPRDSDEE